MNRQEKSPSDNQANVFVARHPIFDRDRQVVAYELLYREGLENAFAQEDHDGASLHVMVNSMILWGMETLTGGVPAYINVTDRLLKQDYVRMFPRESVFVEILETVTPDKDVIKACETLKSEEYTLVLDDFVFAEKFRPLVELADIIKVDFLETTQEDRLNMMSIMSKYDLRYLAEKVETDAVYQEAVSNGFELFQGFFFCRPNIITRREIPPQNLQYVTLLKEIYRSELNINNIETIIKRDLSLTYKLLKYINSAFFGLRVEVKSIKHALTMLGAREIRKWSSLIYIANMNSDKPHELVIQSLMRAYFCEALGRSLNYQHVDDMFILGMFSLVDAIMDMPLDYILEEIPISPSIKAALLNEQETSHFSHILKLVRAYERGEWSDVSSHASQLNMDETQLPELYQQAIAWASASADAGVQRSGS